jgi:hypothetical protein
MTATTDPRPVQNDPERLLSELIAVRDVLRPDAADPRVRAELKTVEAQIEAALEAL